jgi:putative serine protease PepD
LLTLLFVIVSGVAGYSHLLNNRIDNLREQLATNTEAQQDGQDAMGRRVEDLREDSDLHAHQIAATQHELNAQPTPAKVAKLAAPSVFTVYAGEWLGSAFVIRSSGRRADLLTNYHVVSEEYRSGNTSVEIRRGGITLDGQIVDVSEADDLAVIRVDHALPSLKLLKHRADVGDPVLVLGSPNGLGGTVTGGIVSSYRSIEEADYLQFSAPISPGNSGGPVLNAGGAVIGVAVMKDVRDETDGISYAIPTRRVCDALDVC